MPIKKRLSVWSGWLGLANLLAVQAVGSVLSPEAARGISLRRGWSVELVSASARMQTRGEALALERALHAKYRALSLGNEMFSDHSDFAPDLLTDSAPARQLAIGECFDEKLEEGSDHAINDE